MFRDKATKHYLVGFVCAFCIFALLRHATYLVEVRHDSQYYFYMISQIGCVLIVACWMLSIYNRIIDFKVRRMMMYAGTLFILYFLMQMTKYCLFAQASDVRRYMWYGYYTPMTLIPLMALYILRYVSVPGEETLGRKWRALSIPALLICIGFLTNDIHGLAFYIPNWKENGEKGRVLGPIYYIYVVFMVVLLALALYCAYRMRKNVKNRKKLLYPLVPILIGVIYLTIYTVKPDLIKINNHKLFEMGEAFAFMMISFLEMYIQIGLIPSNIGYKRLFALTGIPARVVDSEGKTTYATLGAENRNEESADYLIVENDITGGKFLYGVDLSELNQLNKELDETTTMIETRNELLRHENEITEEREKSDAAIRIYDRISDIVRPQIQEIHSLLSEDDEEEKLRINLIRSAVLNAYVKRRSNMELEAHKNGTLPFAELVTATTESLEYFKLSGTETFISASGEGICDAAQIRTAYCAFENVLENVLGKVDYMTVRVIRENGIRMRFLLNGKNIPDDFSTFEYEGCTMEYSLEENDAELLLCIEERNAGLLPSMEERNAGIIPDMEENNAGLLHSMAEGGDRQ